MKHEKQQAYGKGYRRHGDIVEYKIHAFVAPEKEKEKEEAEKIFKEIMADSFTKINGRLETQVSFIILYT